MLLRAAGTTLDLMDTAIEPIFMIVMWQSVTANKYLPTYVCVPKGSYYIHFTLSVL